MAKKKASTEPSQLAPEVEALLDLLARARLRRALTEVPTKDALRVGSEACPAVDTRLLEVGEERRVVDIALHVEDTNTEMQRGEQRWRNGSPRFRRKS